MGGGAGGAGKRVEFSEDAGSSGNGGGAAICGGGIGIAEGAAL